MEFNWTVNKVQVAQDNLVVKVELTIIGIDGENTASASYVRELVRGNSFIPYEQLTEQQVLDWCFEPETLTSPDLQGGVNTIVKHLKTEGEAQVTGQIERQLAQKESEPALPWVEIPEGTPS